mmetsp:Transcript_24829/g.51962  ORF Transcript_24829/g.51962 Transcript_24829/m.51962 type:complete len:212 (-) Transcript_24829:368-1003(-)
MTLEVQIQRQHPSLERTPKSPLPTLIPLSIDNLKCDILVRRSSAKPQNTKVVRIGPFQKVFRRRRPVDEIGIKNVEFVSLHDLRGRIVVIVMGLVVGIPVVSRLDAVEVTRFTRTVLVLPRVVEGAVVFGVEVDFVVETEFFLEVAKVGFDPLGQRHGGGRGVVVAFRRFLLRLRVAGVRRLPRQSLLVEFFPPRLQLLQLPHQHLRMDFR